jgi:hypothetical protein
MMSFLEPFWMGCADAPLDDEEVRIGHRQSGVERCDEIAAAGGAAVGVVEGLSPQWRDLFLFSDGMQDRKLFLRQQQREQPGPHRDSNRNQPILGYPLARQVWSPERVILKYSKRPRTGKMPSVRRMFLHETAKSRYKRCAVQSLCIDFIGENGGRCRD